MFKILILDDDKEWLNKHQKYLATHFECEKTSSGKKAIKKLCNDKDIKVAIIDEKLYKNEKGGSYVITEVQKNRQDILFIKITEYPVTQREKIISIITTKIQPKLKINEQTILNQQLLHKIVEETVKYTQFFDRKIDDSLGMGRSIEVIKKDSLKEKNEQKEYDILIKKIKNFLETLSNPEQIQTYLEKGFRLVEFGVQKSKPSSEIWQKILPESADQAIADAKIIDFYSSNYDRQKHGNKENFLFISFVKNPFRESDIIQINSICNSLFRNNDFIIFIENDDKTDLDSIENKFNQLIINNCHIVSSYDNYTDILQLRQFIKDELDTLNQEKSRLEKVKENCEAIIKNTITKNTLKTSQYEANIIDMINKIKFISQSPSGEEPNSEEMARFKNYAEDIFENEIKNQIKQPFIWNDDNKTCINVILVGFIIVVIRWVLTYWKEPIEQINILLSNVFDLQSDNLQSQFISNLLWLFSLLFVGDNVQGNLMFLVISSSSFLLIKRLLSQSNKWQIESYTRKVGDKILSIIFDK